MTEPTESEVRQMAEWAGVLMHGPNFSEALFAWNDGRLMWAMLERLWSEKSPLSLLQWSDGTASLMWNNGPSETNVSRAEAVWAACREVRK